MKKARHKKILSLINEYNIDRQEVLLEYLQKEGFNVTQATVSRDIKELNLVKIVASNGEYKYAQNTIVEDTKATFNRFDYFFSEAIKSVDYAMNTIVINAIPAWLKLHVKYSIMSIGTELSVPLPAKIQFLFLQEMKKLQVNFVKK